jgi:FKBP-type peptidyl-prolyl cis-trans isomerase FkpA
MRRAASSGVLLLLVAGIACGPVTAQVPRKARRPGSAPVLQQETFAGRIEDLRSEAIPGDQAVIMPIFVKDGATIRHFVIRLIGTTQTPHTRVLRDGTPLEAAEARETLKTKGLAVRVYYTPKLYLSTNAFLAKRVEVLESMSTSSSGSTVPEGLKIEEMNEGTGDTARPGDRVAVHYTGWLTDGTKFDSSLDRGQPFIFTLGERKVIAGWDLGVAGMRMGGKRKLTIAPELGYGTRGAGGRIPPNATLVFEVELLRIN